MENLNGFAIMNVPIARGEAGYNFDCENSM